MDTLTYKPTLEDAFNMLCGKQIGEGIHRNVFECKIRPELVVKVEKTENLYRSFANYQEQKFWNDNQYRPKVAEWLAPCEFLSPDGRVMLQRKVDPIRESDPLPEKLPYFLTDIKKENFGILNGKLVCIDYAMTIDNVNTRLIKAKWI